MTCRKFLKKTLIGSSRNFFLPILLVLMFWVGPAAADNPENPPTTSANESGSPEKKPNCQFKSFASNFSYENDNIGILHTDSHYTSGLRLAYVFEKNPKFSNSNEENCAPILGKFQNMGYRFANWLTNLIPKEYFHEFTTDQIGFSLGQNIFTPGSEYINHKNIVVNDRPYAGWLYFGISLFDERSELTVLDTKKKVFDTIEINVGIIGPYSFAQEAQTSLHNLRDFVPFNGWDNQLKSEPGFMLAYQRKILLSHYENEAKEKHFDFMPYAGLTAGNVYTYLNGGATFRLGHNIPDDYGPPTIRPSAQGSDFFKSKSAGWYAFATVEGRAVARNIFLDGNTFTSSHNVEKIPLVGDLQFGFVLLPCKHYRLTFANVFRSREFYAQKSMDNYGIANLSYSYD